MKNNNSPDKTVSRCLHSTFFDNITDFYLKDWIPVIYLHIARCQHIKCKYYKSLQDNDMLTLNSFRYNQEYIKFLEENEK